MFSLKPGQTFQQPHDDSESWLVSYADMITLLLGFFVVLYSFSKIDDGKFQEVGKDIAQAFGKDVSKAVATQQPIDADEARQLRAFRLLLSMANLGDSTEESIANIERAAAEFQSETITKELLSKGLLSKGLDQSKGDGVIQIATDAYLELVLPENLLFASGSAELLAASSQTLRDIVSTIVGTPAVSEIQVIGHTDSRPARARSIYPDNWSLSAARAGAVVTALQVHGLKSENLRAIGMADREPLVPDYDLRGMPIPTNMAKNRRVHIILKKVFSPNRSGGGGGKK